MFCLFHKNSQQFEVKTQQPMLDMAEGAFSQLKVSLDLQRDVVHKLRNDRFLQYVAGC